MYVGWKLFNNIRQHLVASMWDGSSGLTLYCCRLVTKAKLICGLCKWNVFMLSLFTGLWLKYCSQYLGSCQKQSYKFLKMILFQSYCNKCNQFRSNSEFLALALADLVISVVNLFNLPFYCLFVFSLSQLLLQHFSFPKMKKEI